MFGDAAVALFITGLRQRYPGSRASGLSASCVAIHTRPHNAYRGATASILFESI